MDKKEYQHLELKAARSQFFVVVAVLVIFLLWIAAAKYFGLE